MKIKELIADIYNAHCKDHTASDFEVCKKPLCEMAREAEASIADLQARIAERERQLSIILGNFGRCKDISCYVMYNEAGEFVDVIQPAVSGVMPYNPPMKIAKVGAK